MKPAYGGGWKDVYKVDNPEEFFAAYDQTRDPDDDGAGGDRVHRVLPLLRHRAGASVRIMRYDPRAPHETRYVADAGPPIPTRWRSAITRDALALCDALGYDMNTVEFAVRDGVPYAIDFMNCAPDADLYSVGEENFRWVVANMAELLVERVLRPDPSS